MSAKSETLYLKIDQNTIVTDRHVTLGDIAKWSARMLRLCAS